jgi:hypothetical protein
VRLQQWADMSHLLAGARARAYITMLGWLGDGRLRHCDVARDREGEVVAITFARDMGYIESVREIDASDGQPLNAAPASSTERSLRRTIFLLSCALAIVTACVVLEEVAERFLG